jgi:hypothetical protein
MAISEKNSLKSGDFGTFYSQKSFVWITLDLYLLLSDKNLPKQKKIGYS